MVSGIRLIALGLVALLGLSACQTTSPSSATITDQEIRDRAVADCVAGAKPGRDPYLIRRFCGCYTDAAFQVYPERLDHIRAALAGRGTAMAHRQTDISLRDPRILREFSAQCPRTARELAGEPVKPIPKAELRAMAFESAVNFCAANLTNAGVRDSRIRPTCVCLMSGMFEISPATVQHWEVAVRDEYIGILPEPTERENRLLDAYMARECPRKNAWLDSLRF